MQNETLEIIDGVICKICQEIINNHYVAGNCEETIKALAELITARAKL